MSEMVIQLVAFILFSVLSVSVLKANRELRAAIQNEENVMAPHFFRYVYPVLIVGFIFMAGINLIKLISRAIS